MNKVAAIALAVLVAFGLGAAYTVHQSTGVTVADGYGWGVAPTS
jgi:hypothetical protein